MGILSFLAGNTKTVEKVVDAGINGVDKLFYTEEEKAENRAKMQELYYKYVEISASESTAQSISRRMICLPLVYTWLLLNVVYSAFGVAMPELNIEAISNAIDNMNTPALAAIGFYVGRHLIADWKKG